MKKFILISFVLLAVVSMGSCTNDEGDNDIDIITPNEQESILRQNIDTPEKPQ